MILKDFFYSSIEIKHSIFIDIFNTHTDTDEESIAARYFNMAQLAEYINRVSARKRCYSYQGYKFKI